jgi:hypothetical protein
MIKIISVDDGMNGSAPVMARWLTQDKSGYVGITAYPRYIA